MAFDPYCRLYIHSEKEFTAILGESARLLNGVADGSSVDSGGGYLMLKINDDFDEASFRSEKRFVFAKYTAELEGVGAEVNEESFIRSTCKLITGLRNFGVMVSASCDFEDQIVEYTGWNWTDGGRDHPPVGEG